MDFSDYASIISDDRNWEEVFARCFKDKEMVLFKLRELEPIRVDLAHSRALTKTASMKLRLYSEELGRMMRNVGG